jgi:hypothetical protein
MGPKVVAELSKFESLEKAYTNITSIETDAKEAKANKNKSPAELKAEMVKKQELAKADKVARAA